MNRNLVQREQICRLSLPKGEGGVRVQYDSYKEGRARHLNPLPLTKGNLRFNEIQAAIGRVELRNIDDLNEHRRRVAARYTERLSHVVKTPPEKQWAYAGYHMYVIRTERRDELARHLQSKGINTGIHYPVANHQQPAITKIYSDLPRLPKTEAVVKEILSLPMYGELPLEDVDYVCDTILEFFGM